MSYLQIGKEITERIVFRVFLTEQRRLRKPIEIVARMISMPWEIADYIATQPTEAFKKRAAEMAATEAQAVASDSVRTGPDPSSEAGTEPDFHFAAYAKDLHANRVLVVSVQDTPVALYSIDGETYATSNICPHAGGPIGEGDLTGCRITCPLHGWTFDVKTGSCTNIAGEKLETFPVRRVGDKIHVNVSR